MIRYSKMDEVGDIAAPPGSRDWALAVRLDIQCTLNDIVANVRHLQDLLALCREHKGHCPLADRNGHPFATFAGFCTAPQPFGLGFSGDRYAEELLALLTTLMGPDHTNSGR